jgi:molybdopterin/thiamine biosynthesis adenylyltransferase
LGIHLNQINPHVEAENIDRKFKHSKEFIAKMDEFDLIIDCTGENGVLYDLEKFEFKKDKIFVTNFIWNSCRKLIFISTKGEKI